MRGKLDKKFKDYKEILFKKHNLINEIKNLNYKSILTYIYIFLSYLSIHYIFGLEVETTVPQLFFSLFWIELMILIINLSKYKCLIFSFFYLWFLIFLIIQYFHTKIIGTPFLISEIFNATESLSYLNAIIEKINIKFVFYLLLIIFNWLISIKLIKKNLKLTNKYKLIKLFITIIIFIPILILVRYVTIRSLGTINYTWNDFYDFNNNRDTYDNFNDRTKAIKLTGIYEYTIRDIYLYLKDNISLNSMSKKKEIKKYFDENNYDIIDNDYTSIFKGKNAIIIMAESIDDWLITEDIMPTVYNMQKNSINFTNRYAPSYGGGRTLNTEYSLNTGLYIPINYNIYNSINNFYPNSLANMFNSKNYITTSIHYNKGNFYNRSKLHKVFGYQNSYFIADIYNKEYIKDMDLLKNDEIYNLMVSKKDKFMTFFITYSAHLPYSSANSLCNELNGNEYECIKRLASYTDEAIKILLNNLKKDNLLNDTVIIFVTDHYAYGFNEKEIEKIKGGSTSEYLDKVPFFIWSNSMDRIEVSNYMDTQDILPTILNLFGIEYDSCMYIGTDVLGNNHQNYVYFSDGSYIGDKKIDIKKINEKIKINDLIIKTNYKN